MRPPFCTLASPQAGEHRGSSTGHRRAHQDARTDGQHGIPDPDVREPPPCCPSGGRITSRYALSPPIYHAAMRTRTVSSLALVTLLATAGCTSGSEPQEDAGDEQTEQAAATEGAGMDGWLCDDISPASLKTLAGGELTDPTEVQVQDDDEAWVCEARDGQTPLARVTLQVGEEARDEARERVGQTEGVEPGPDYLGESYTSPALVVGLTLCRGTEGGPDVDEPYVMLAESLVDSEEDLSEPLRSTLAQLAGSLDQRYGCSPTLARSEAAEVTESP